MQDGFVGDIGDFGKYGLLRALRGIHPRADPCLKLGLVWYVSDYDTLYRGARHNDPKPATRGTLSPWVVFLDPDVGLAARSNEHEALPRQGLNAANAKEFADAVVRA